ncbi:unnamed protein product, partial [Mesorhabditis belari]|uniref:GDP-mannose 4,6-dehydratase n=1 Tax=Mesorhabditis belari TaxID=2138241 RepID=A0AAF3J962_9BILA
MRYRVLLLKRWLDPEDVQFWHGLGVADHEYDDEMPLKAQLKRRITVTFPIDFPLKVGDVVYAEKMGEMKFCEGYCQVIDSFPTAQFQGEQRVTINLVPVVFSINFLNHQSGEAFIGWSPEVGVVIAPSLDLRPLNKFSPYEVYYCRLICSLFSDNEALKLQMSKDHGAYWCATTIERCSARCEVDEAEKIAKAYNQPPNDGRYHFYLKSEPFWMTPRVSYSAEPPQIEHTKTTSNQPSIELMKSSLYTASFEKCLISCATLHDLKIVTDVGVLVDVSLGGHVYTATGLKQLRSHNPMHLGKFVEIRGVEGPSNINTTMRVARNPDKRSIEWINCRLAAPTDLPIPQGMFDLNCVTLRPNVQPQVLMTTIFAIDLNQRKLLPFHPFLRADLIKLSEAMLTIDLLQTPDEPVVADLLYDGINGWTVVAIRNYNAKERPIVAKCLNREMTCDYGPIVHKAWHPIKDKQAIEISGWVIALQREFAFIWPCLPAKHSKGWVVIKRSCVPMLASLGDFVHLSAVEIEYTAAKPAPIELQYSSDQILRWTYGFELEMKRIVYEKTAEVTVWLVFYLLDNPDSYWNPTEIERPEKGNWIYDATYRHQVFCTDRQLNDISGRVMELESEPGAGKVEYIILPCLLNAKQKAPNSEHRQILRLDKRIILKEEVRKTAVYANMPTRYKDFMMRKHHQGVHKGVKRETKMTHQDKVAVNEILINHVKITTMSEQRNESSEGLEAVISNQVLIMDSTKEELLAFRARKIALITGISGQDGSYLAELLLQKGYAVHGVIRRSSSFNTSRIEHLYSNPVTHDGGSKFFLHYGDMTDSSCLIKLISTIQPTEVYHLAAQSHVKVSFDLPEYTAEVDAVGTLRLLDAIHACGLTNKVRFYQASTSELYGKVQEVPQKETTPFYPRSPYAVAKLYAYWIVVNYREAYSMFACNGILFNHESPRRGETFVTRKITRGVAKISLGQQETIELGNLDARRDWGHAKEYVEAMWRILQHDVAEDFVIATGEYTKVRTFVEMAFLEINKEIVWEGEGVNEVGREKDTGVIRVKVNPKYYRPTEVEQLLGDATKAREKLGWQPKVTLKELVSEMMKCDIDLMKANPRA